MAMEWVLVRYPRVRDVFFDGRRWGPTNELLTVPRGRHTFALGVPVDYQPSRQKVTVAGTTSATPVVIRFRPDA